jgi:hypothetical protein
VKFAFEAALVRKLGLVFGDKSWRQYSTEGIFYDLVVFAGTKQYADCVVIATERFLQCVLIGK